MIFIFNLILYFLVCFQLNKQNRDFVFLINEGQFCLRCSAGGPGLKKTYFFLNKQRSVLSPLPCGRPRPWKSSCDFRHNPQLKCKTNKCAKKKNILWQILWFGGIILQLISTIGFFTGWFVFFAHLFFLHLIAGWCLKSQDDFQGRGRPQGNRDKTDLRLFPKNNDFSRSGPPAGQRGQNWPLFI